ncbi:MAG: hypothetical protein QM768_11445 [Agriterribacter sp.]
MENIGGYGIYDYVVVVGFIIATLFVANKNPHYIIYLLPAAGSFWFFIDFLTMITPIKIVPAVFILATLNKGRGYLRFKNDMWAQGMLILFCIYCIVGLAYTLGFQGFESYSPYKRVVIQFMTYLNQLLIYFILKVEIKTSKDLYVFFKVFIITTTFLCLYGFYQYIAFELGLPFRGIVYTADQVSAAYDSYYQFFRINSLANEPKRLGNILVMGILMLLACKRGGNKWINILIIVHLACGVLTYSTTLFILLGILVPCLLILSFIDKELKLFKSVIFGAFLISIPLLLIFRERIFTIYNVRVVGQIQYAQHEHSYYLDKYAFDYFKENWQGMLIGYGLGNYNFILEKHIGAGLNSFGLEIMNSGVLNLVYDFGYIGTIIFLWPLIAGIIQPYRMNDPPILRKSKKPLYLAVLIVSFLLAVWHWNFMILGALNHELDREQNNSFS